MLMVYLARASADWRRILEAVWGSLQVKLFEIGGTPISVATIVTVLGILSLTLVASQLLQRATIQAFRFRGAHQEGTVRAVTRLAHYLTLLIGFSVAIQTMGINLGALFAAGAIFAVGLGFAMQSIAQNFVSGVILLIERSIKPGDVVTVADRIVKIVKMGIRATVVETRDGENLIVPNSVLIQSTVTNFTMGDENFRIRIAVGVTYSSDMALVKSGLEQVAAELSKKWDVKDKKPIVVMTGFGDNAVTFEIGVWMHQPWEHLLATSELHEAVWSKFKDLDMPSHSWTCTSTSGLSKLCPASLLPDSQSGHSASREILDRLLRPARQSPIVDPWEPRTD